MDDALKEAALEYHRLPRPGKIAIVPTKALETQRDLSLAYSPGVAAACTEIAADPLKSYEYTARGNLVAVITNGTAVLGLGNIGALAAKPVMEGKAVLFQKFASIDSIDIEIDETDVDKLVDAIAALEPSFGGINLEDIKAPECFEVERRLRERMKIPVFHDDQHGTAIIVGAAVTNWLHLAGRKITDVRLVANGAGAAATACLKMLKQLGLPKENIIVCDLAGVIYEGRTEEMDGGRHELAVRTEARTLAEAVVGADIFLGLSAPNVITAEEIGRMADKPLVMALANPTPEIMPEEVRKTKPDAVICTGRSDYPNQVNNVLCFPFLFRGALDVGATAITEGMKIACVEAIAALARKEVTAEVAAVYAGENIEFGLDHLIPKPFDPRLITELPVAVAKAAIADGVATRAIADWDAYAERLASYTYKTTMVMRPLFTRAKRDLQRVLFCEGEEEKVLRALQVVVDDKIARPLIIGRRQVVERRLARLHMRIEIGRDVDLVDPEGDRRYRDYWTTYHEVMQRRGVTPAVARSVLRTNPTVIGALLLLKGEADAIICGAVGHYRNHMKDIVDIVGLTPGVETAAALGMLTLPKGPVFICDTQVNPCPSIAQVCEMTLLAAERVQSFGIKPKIALLSHSNFGTHDTESAFKMRAAVEDLRQRAPHLEIDGEMHGDAALSEKIRQEIVSNSPLQGEANLFIMPNVDAANISFNMLKVLADGISIGPMLLGVARPAHIVTPSATTRGLINMAAVAAVSAQEDKARRGANGGEPVGYGF